MLRTDGNVIYSDRWTNKLFARLDIVLPVTFDTPVVSYPAPGMVVTSIATDNWRTLNPDEDDAA